MSVTYHRQNIGYLNLKKKHLLFGISSTNIHTLVPSLYQCTETCNIKVVWLLSQPLPHLCFSLFVISEMSAIKVVFKQTNQTGVVRGQVRAVRWMFRKFPP
jgi:hypothetical protein